MLAMAKASNRAQVFLDFAMLHQGYDDGVNHAIIFARAMIGGSAYPETLC